MLIPDCDKDGFLLHFDLWTEDVGEWLAAQEHLVLTESHWQIIKLLRSYYSLYESSPAMRPLIKYIKQHLPAEHCSSAYLLSLFPNSPARLAAKIAGLPKPDNCL